MIDLFKSTFLVVITFFIKLIRTTTESFRTRNFVSRIRKNHVTVGSSAQYFLDVCRFSIE